MQRCAYVSNNHGDALHEWLSTARSHAGPLAVLHVDAHNDLNVPRPAALWRHAAEHWRSNATLRDEIVSSVDHIDFQLAAVHLGVTDRVIWVKQSDTIGSPCVHSVNSLQFDDASASFEGDAVLLSDTYDASAERAAWADRHYAFHEVPEHSLLQPAVARTLSTLLNQPAGWILDIDLDVFVHGASRPGRPPWVRTSHSSAFPFDECGRLLSACPRWSDTRRCAVWEALEAVASGNGIESCAGECEGLHTDERLCVQAFAGYARALPRTPGLHVAERALLVEQLHSSAVVQEATAASIARLEALLGGIERPPLALTIARSVDGYTRVADVAALEVAVLEMVGRVFAGATRPCVRYASGTAPIEALQQLSSARDLCAGAESAFGGGSLGGQGCMFMGR